MPSATASGADTGSARSRDHNQGNQGRSFTPEQEAAVIRIRRCKATAFYDILGLETVKTSCTEGEIKKAYRKQSLLTHPDKNGHQHADEAFKMVSRAFGILGDKEKREKFDKFGTDPDSRFESARAQHGFPGFAQRQGGMPRGGMFEEELTPEEMFARFFGGQGFGGGPFGGGFDTGPQFVFNFGGGPGIRVHQFGGARPRTRPREAQGGRQQEGSTLQTLLGLLPIILFFILPIVTSIFSGESSAGPAPQMVFDHPQAPYTEGRMTPNLGVEYFVDPNEIASFTDGKLNTLDRTAERTLVRALKTTCDKEVAYKQRLRDAAQGWFYQDPEKMAVAERANMPSCERLQNLGISR